MKNRNYAIDFFRFFFMIIICIHHFQPYLTIKLINSGYLAVEFFFILSGYYLYRSFISNKYKSSIDYTMKKVSKIWILYIYAMCLTGIFNIILGILKNESIMEYFIKFFTESMMLQNIGFFYGGNNYPLWYFSVLIIGGYIIWEMLEKDKKCCINLFFPIFIIIFFNFLNSYTNGKLECFETLNGWYIPLLRGISELMIGCILSSIVIDHSEKLNLIVKDNKVLIHIIEILVYSSSILLVVLNTKYEFMMLILIPLIILFCNLKNTLAYKIFNKNVFKNNAKLTLSMYFNHAAIILAVGNLYKLILYKFMSDIEIIIFMIIIIIFYSMLVNFILDKFRMKSQK